MTEIVKEFIEKNIALIESEDYDALYDEAYSCLSDNQTEELTNSLSSALSVDFEEFAKQNILKQFEYSLKQYLKDKSRNDEIYLSSFVRLGMNHINGLEWDEFQLLVEQHLEDDTRVIIDNDGLNIFIKRRI